MEESHLVLFQQEQNAVVVLLHNGVFAGNHFGDVHLHAGGGDAMVCKVVVGMVKMLAGLQQSLGGNAADIGAGTAGCGASGRIFPLVNTSYVKAQLGRTNGRDIAAGTCADDDDIKVLRHDLLSDQMSNNKREGSSIASLIVTRPSTASRPSMMRWS